MNTLMQHAVDFANKSTCTKRKVGAVLVRNEKILHASYNGTLPGTCNNCEDADNKTKPETIHAEQNMVAWCARMGIKMSGASLWVTTAPCIHCAKLLIQSGIVEVFYKEDYKNTEGLDLLNKNDIVYKQIK